MNNLIDTIKIQYSFKCNEKDLLINWLSSEYSDEFQEIAKPNRVSNYRCDIDNMKLFINTNFLFIVGSIHKFYVGNNVESMNLEDIPLAVDKLNEKLGNIVNIREATVKRLDIGVNLKMDYDPSLYVAKIHSITSKKNIRFNNETLTVGNKSRGMTIYNKTIEATKNSKNKKFNLNIPSNLIRIEYFINSDHVLKKLLNASNPTIKHVLDNTDKLPGILYDEYKKLDKDYKTELTGINNINELYMYTISIAGIEKCQNIIDQSYRLKLISNLDRSRFKSTVRKAISFSSRNGSRDPLVELDEKVYQWYYSETTTNSNSEA
jgi:hypothetical protein